MCRIAAYAGPPRPLSTLIFDAPHSLEVQAYRPRTMVSGHVNVDGTGICWWPIGDEAQPLRYVTERPPWSDPNLPELAPRLSGRVQLAAVRSATGGMPYGPAAVGPFSADGLAFAHNGYVADFEAGVARSLLAELPDDLHASLGTRTDSTVLFALVRLARREDPGAPLASCLERAVSRVASAAHDADSTANLTCLLTDGRRIAAIRAAVECPANTLHLCSAGDSLRIASEPLDDHPWEPLAVGAAVEFDTGLDR